MEVFFFDITVLSAFTLPLVNTTQQLHFLKPALAVTLYANTVQIMLFPLKT